MADDNPFQVIRDAILNAGTNHPEAEGRRAPGEQGDGGNADRYARAVLIALEHSGFEIVRHIPEPPDVD